MGLFDLAESQCVNGHARTLALRWRTSGPERRDFSYEDLARQADLCAALFLSLGLKSGEVVGVMTGRRPETVIAALGIWRAGGVFCPLFNDFGPDPVLSRLGLGNIAMLVVDDVAYQRAIVPIRAQATSLRHVLVIGDNIAEGCLGFKTGLADQPKAASGADPSGAGLLHFTSGTSSSDNPAATGAKAVRHSATIDLAIAATARTVLDVHAGEMIWCTGEPGWVAHSAYGLIAPLAVGATIFMDGAPLTPTRCLSVLEDEPITVLYTTPTLVRGLMGTGAACASRYRPKALRIAASVGEPLSGDAVEWGERVLGTPFRDSWWQTETGTIILANLPPDKPRPGSLGRPIPGVMLGIAQRTAAGLVVENGESGQADGELAVRLETTPAWDSIVQGGGAAGSAPGGWHLTGDIVHRDADGFYSFLARSDELMNVAGRSVGPFEIESALMAHPAVFEIGVVGVHDAHRHQRIVAYVAVNPGFEPGPALRRELAIYAKDRLGPELAPAEILFIADFPRTKSGKIIRKGLSALYERRGA